MKNAFVKNIISKLFDAKEPIESLNGALVRSESFKNCFEEWKAHSDFTETYALLYRLFSCVAIDGDICPEFNVMVTPQANGFYFNHTIDIEPDVFPYILDSLRDKVIIEGYSLYMSDTRYKEVSAGIQQIDRHYLKPKINRVPGEIRDQKFGNISIELYFLDDQPQYLKVLATVYSGKNYSEPWNLISLGEQLFCPKEE